MLAYRPAWLTAPTLGRQSKIKGWSWDSERGYPFQHGSNIRRWNEARHSSMSIVETEGV